MIEDIRRRLELTPFVPFAVRTADGHECPVPAVDHIWLPPGGRRVVISDDRGSTVVLPGLMISGLVHAGNGDVGNAAA
jgi:hypothetical protein